MDPIRRLMYRFFPYNDHFPEVYIARFIQPHYERMIAAGIPPERAHQIITEAIHRSNYPWPLPGPLVREAASKAIAEQVGLTLSSENLKEQQPGEQETQ